MTARHAVVTGAAQGIGAAVSTALHEAGYGVIGVDADSAALEQFAACAARLHPHLTETCAIAPCSRRRSRLPPPARSGRG